MTLAGAVTALLDVLAAEDADAVGVADAWQAVEQVAPRDRVREPAAVVGELVPDDSAGEAAMRATLAGRYRVVRPFLVLLSDALPLDAAPAGQKILAAVRTLPDLAARRVRQRPLSRNEIDADLVPPVWGRAVYGNRDLSPGAVDRDAYVLCVLEQLRAALRRVDLNRIRAHWPDMLRVAGSLVTSQVRAYDLLRMLAQDGRPSPLGQAFADYGRIAKTLHLLALVDPADDGYRRTVNTHLTVQESRHRLARKIFHGQRGELRQAYREGQEDQLGALGLVLNAVVLWNTRYIDAAVAPLRSSGYPVSDEDAARLSPLGDKHINMLGRTPSLRRPGQSCVRCVIPLVPTTTSEPSSAAGRLGGLLFARDPSTDASALPTMRRGPVLRSPGQGRSERPALGALGGLQPGFLLAGSRVGGSP